MPRVLKPTSLRKMSGSSMVCRSCCPAQQRITVNSASCDPECRSVELGKGSDRRLKGCEAHTCKQGLSRSASQYWASRRSGIGCIQHLHSATSSQGHANSTFFKLQHQHQQLQESRLERGVVCFLMHVRT